MGNGASIAINKKFAYETLYRVAEEKRFLGASAPIFEKLKTKDFEHVLLACWYANHVNEALGTPSNNISDAYKEVRKALINAVHSVHPEYADVQSELERVGGFASGFNTVVSLNYDITFYWAMMLFNDGKGNWFKDAFIKGKFDTDWERLRKPYNTDDATLVFYPHGSLLVARDYLGQEKKIVDRNDDLLKTITEQWSSEKYVPVFVSEGTGEEKLASIYRSHYLTNVYEQVLPKLGENLVVYGWNFGDRDKHVLDAIFKSKKQPKQMAVSVFTGQSEEDQQAFCNRVLQAVPSHLSTKDVIFFDAQSPGCWNNS